MKHFEDFYREAQQYPSILKNYEEKGEIFTDQNFHPSPNFNVIESEVSFDDKTTIWERIDKFYTAPLFKREAIHEDAIQQGQLGNCYFIASLSRIARQPKIVELLFDTRTKNNYENNETINLKCGAVIVFIYIFGRKTPVLIDTLIPFERGTRKPRFSHPTDIKYSPWFCLVEKAYAKANGCYSYIIGGSLSKAIYNLFGYYPCYKEIDKIVDKKEKELFESKSDQNSIEFNENEYLFSLLMQWQYENAVIGADILPDKLRKNVTENDVIDNGLVTDHTYLIIKVRREEGKNFICLKNPWGDHEWLGDWSDTSPLWTPALKKSLGVRLKNNGTFWMVDRDFFHFFTSLYVAKPINPEYHCKSVFTYLSPGDDDGHSVEEREAHLENRQTFAFKLKNVKVKEQDQKNESENTVDDAKVYIRVEKRSPFGYASDNNNKNKAPNYSLFVIFNKGQKIDFDKINEYSRQTVTTKTQFFRETVHVIENDPFVIVLQRVDKADYTEECYIQFSCKYDFDLYDVDHPENLAEEDEKIGVIFDNQSRRYKNISKTICTKEINGKEINAFDDKETNKFNFNNLVLNKGNENSSQFFEYDIDESFSSSCDKNKSNKNDESYNSSSSSVVQGKENCTNLIPTTNDYFLDLKNYQKKAKISDTIFSNLYEIVEIKTNIKFSAKASKFEINNMTPSEIENLINEIKSLVAINHPSILKFIGYSTVNFRNKPKPIIVTELAPNQSLDDILESERNGKKVPDWDDTKKLINIFGIASGMSYLHSHDILHHDLKPNNILVDKDLHPKISDFGLLIKNQNQMTMNYQPRYSAPEVLNSEECTKESEVYSFSLIVYEIITNQKAFHNLSNLNQIFREVVINEERPEFNSTIPECYRSLIESCWKQNPKERLTFKEIVNNLKTDSRFITPNINKDDYFNYIEYIKENSNESYLNEQTENKQKISSDSGEKEQTKPISNISNHSSDKKSDENSDSIKDTKSDKNLNENSDSIKNTKSDKNLNENSDSIKDTKSDKNLKQNSDSNKKSDKNSSENSDQNPNKKQESESNQDQKNSNHESEDKPAEQQNTKKKTDQKQISLIKNRNIQLSKVSLFDKQFNIHADMPINQICEIEVIRDYFISCLYSTEKDEQFNEFIIDFNEDKFASFHFCTNKKTNQEFVNFCTSNKLLLLPTTIDDDNKINPQITEIINLIKQSKVYEISSHDETKLPRFTNIDLTQSFPEKAELKQVQGLVSLLSSDILPENIKYDNSPITFSTFAKLSWSTIAVYHAVSNPFEFNMSAAEKGNSAALFNVGLMYSNGDGVQQDKIKAASFYQKAADQGLAKAQFNLGCMYSKGCKDGIEQDKQKAVELFEKAANQGHLKSQLNLGNIYSSGDGVSVDYKKAVEFYEKAADQNDPEAQTNLGIIYQKGIGKIIPKNLKRASELYQKAADQGIVLAQFNLGVLYAKGDNEIPQDKEKAFELFQKAADQGDADAQLNLAAMYAKGEPPVTQDIDKAIQLYENAAKQGNMKAQFNLAVMYAKGNGVEKNITKAIKYYEKAVDQGMHQAMLNLGVIYFKGTEGIDVDKQKAASLFDRASDKNLRAMFNLAVMLQKGDGIEKDEKKAFELYERAASMNSPEALLNLGIIYDEGNSFVNQDKKKAVQLYKRAAELGNAKAMLNLGIMYQDGQGCKANKTKAKEYFKMAAKQGNAQAQTNLALLLLLDDDADDEKAMKYLKSAADLGNSSAMLNVAKRYRDNGDMNNAIKYFSKAASHGIPKAQFELGKIFLNGNGTEENLDKAENLLQEAAASKVNDALLALGDLYSKKGDIKEARKYYKLALDAGVKGASEKISPDDNFSSSDFEKESENEDDGLQNKDTKENQNDNEKNTENDISILRNLDEKEIKLDLINQSESANEMQLEKLKYGESEKEDQSNQEKEVKSTPENEKEDQSNQEKEVKPSPENEKEDQSNQEKEVKPSPENEKEDQSNQEKEVKSTPENEKEDQSNQEKEIKSNPENDKEIKSNPLNEREKEIQIEEEESQSESAVEVQLRPDNQSESAREAQSKQEKQNESEKEIQIEEEESQSESAVEVQLRPDNQSESAREAQSKQEKQNESEKEIQIEEEESQSESGIEVQIKPENQSENGKDVQSNQKNEKEKVDQIEKPNQNESKKEVQIKEPNESEKEVQIEEPNQKESIKEVRFKLENQNESEKEVRFKLENQSESEKEFKLNLESQSESAKEFKLNLESQSESAKEFQIKLENKSETDKENQTETEIQLESQNQKNSEEEEFRLEMQSESQSSNISPIKKENKIMFKIQKTNSKLISKKQTDSEYDSSDSSEINQLCITCDEYSQIDETSQVEKLFNSLEDRIKKIHNKIVKPYKNFKSSLNDISNMFLISSLSSKITSYTQSNSSLNKAEKEIDEYLSKQKDSKRVSFKIISSSSSSPIIDDELSNLQSEVKSLELKIKQLDEQLRAARNRPQLPQKSSNSHSIAAKSLLEYSSSDFVSSSAVETVLSLNKSAEEPSKVVEQSHVTKIQPPKENGQDSRLSRSPRISHSPHPRRSMIGRLKKKADEGDEEAQFTLGACYEVGKGVRKNSGSALKYYMKSADQSNPNAQFAAAVCYTSGKGTKVDKDKAFVLFEKAANQGHDKAQFAVGHFYEFEKEKNEKNIKKASEYYHRAADQGNLAAISAIRTENDAEICIFQLT